MSKIIAVANSKGGIGKSSTVQNVGVILHQLGYKVLCVDADSQGHLSVGFAIIPEAMPYTLTNLIDSYVRQESITKENVTKAIVYTHTVDILPSTFLLDNLEVALNSINDREYALSEIISLILDDYDMVLIDCNSSRNIFTINALACADNLIIPTQAQFLSVGAVELMLSTVKSIKRRINPKLNVLGILLTMYQGNTNQSKGTKETVIEEYKDLVFSTIIPSSIKVPDSQKIGKSVVEYDKSNPVSIAYRNFVEKELLANE